MFVTFNRYDVHKQNYIPAARGSSGWCDAAGTSVWRHRINQRQYKCCQSGIQWNSVTHIKNKTRFMCEDDVGWEEKQTRSQLLSPGVLSVSHTVNINIKQAVIYRVQLYNCALFNNTFIHQLQMVLVSNLVNQTSTTCSTPPLSICCGFFMLTTIFSESGECGNVFAVLFHNNAGDRQKFALSQSVVGQGIQIVKPQLEGMWSNMCIIWSTDPMLPSDVNRSGFVPKPFPESVRTVDQALRRIKFVG